MANIPSLWSNSFLDDRRGTDPIRALMQMRREMDNLFESFSGTQALFDIEDKDSHFLINFEVPGLSKNDIKIEVKDNMLHVWGERNEEKEEKKGRRSERFYGSFENWITLPQNVKTDSIEARIEHGVLQLAIPKAAVAPAKQIRIGESKTGFFSRLLGTHHKDTEGKEHGGEKESAA